MPARKKEDAPPAKNAALHAIVGTDEAQVREAAQALVQKLTPPGADSLSQEIISAQADNSEHASRICASAIEAIQTLPFFGTEGKVVWLKDVTFLQDDVTGRAETTLKALERLQGELEHGLPEGVQLVISAGPVDKRRSFWKFLEKAASVQTFDLPDTKQEGWQASVQSLAATRAEVLGINFAPEALELFVMLAGERTQQIASELDKLALYIHPRIEAAVDDVRAIVPLTRSAIVWQLGDLIVRRQLKPALGLLDMLLGQNESPIGILLAGIIPKLRNLLVASDLVERHRTPVSDYRSFVAALERLPAAETAHIPRKKDGSGINGYPLFLAAQEGRAYTTAELRQALQDCLKANHRLVTTGLDGRLVLSQLLIRLMTSGKPAPARPAAPPARQAWAGARSR